MSSQPKRIKRSFYIITTLSISPLVILSINWQNMSRLQFTFFLPNSQCLRGDAYLFSKFSYSNTSLTSSYRQDYATYHIYSFVLQNIYKFKLTIVNLLLYIFFYLKNVIVDCFYFYYIEFLHFSKSFLGFLFKVKTEQSAFTE